MSNADLIFQINSLPVHLKNEVEDFVAFLKTKSKKKIKQRKFGCAAGKIIMAKDFDAPLEDFKAYM